MKQRRLHNACLHTAGVVEGLEVEATHEGTEIIVRPGYAIDGDGRDLYLVEPIEQQVDVGAYESPVAVYVVIRYGEQPVDTRTHPNHPEYSGHAFIQEKPIVEITTEVPDNARCIELARIDLDRNATRVQDAVDPDEPGSNQIDRRYVQMAGAVQGTIRLRGLAKVAGKGTIKVAPDSELINTHIDTVPVEEGHRVYLANAYPVAEGSREVRISWHIGSQFKQGSIEYRLYFKNYSNETVQVEFVVYRVD